MDKITEAIREYSDGKKTLEELNAFLKEEGSNLQIIPGKNQLTEEDLAVTSCHGTPESANGYGLLDSGTGSFDKVHVVNGILDYAVNMVIDGEGHTNMLAYAYIGGFKFEVKGDQLVDC